MKPTRDGTRQASRILLAEDDANLRRGIAELLALEGFACESAPDGEIAIAAFGRRRPDLIILDIMMPKVDGLSVCKAVRLLDRRVPILILSARDTEMDRVIGLEQGADDYLVKPFGPRELIARINSLLRRAREAHPEPEQTVFRLDDLQVDARALRGRRGDDVIELTARDVALLRVLYRRRGEAVSRDELLDECWGRNHFPNSRALDQFISVLRRKVERSPAAPRIIKTVYGYGYRFDE